MAPDDDAIREEVVRLRDWRHNVAAPRLSAALAQVKQLSADLTMVKRRLDDVESRLDRMARADEIAEAVTQHARKSRRGILTAWQALLVGAAALAGIVNIILNSIHH